MFYISVPKKRYEILVPLTHFKGSENIACKRLLITLKHEELLSKCELSQSLLKSLQILDLHEASSISLFISLSSILNSLR